MYRHLSRIYDGYIIMFYTCFFYTFHPRPIILLRRGRTLYYSRCHIDCRHDLSIFGSSSCIEYSCAPIYRRWIPLSPQDTAAPPHRPFDCYIIIVSSPAPPSDYGRRRYDADWCSVMSYILYHTV